MKKIAAIILAAGEGKRMKSQSYNKVTLKIGGKHMIVYAIDLLDKLGIKNKIAVVGFAKESVMNVLGDRVSYAVQQERLGTAHAVKCALEKIDKDITDVLILQGDDSALYEEKIIKKIIDLHFLSGAAFTFLTIDIDNPFGLGRVIRDDNDKLIRIVEEKNATAEEKKTKEVNPACYLVSIDFLKKYVEKINKDEVTGEYYLTNLINIAIDNNEKIETVKGGKMKWRGINTPQELRKAEEIFMGLGN